MGHPSFRAALDLDRFRKILLMSTAMTSVALIATACSRMVPAPPPADNTVAVPYEGVGGPPGTSTAHRQPQLKPAS